MNTPYPNPVSQQEVQANRVARSARRSAGRRQRKIDRNKGAYTANVAKEKARRAKR